MITIVHGIGVGAGKSYYVASHLLGHLSAGGTVVATDNFKLKWPEFKALAAKRYGVALEDDQYIIIEAKDTERLPELTPPGTDDNPVLLVLDEAQDQLNTRDTRDVSKRKLFAWLCQSRHDNNDLIFITQDQDNIDVQIRRLATYVVKVRNLSTFMIGGLTWPFKQFLWQVCDRGGKNVLRRNYVWHDTEIFGAYVSKAMKGAHQRVGAPVPRKTLKRVSKRKPMKAMLFLGIVGLIIGACFGVPRVSAMWGGGDTKQAAAQRVSHEKPAVFATPAPPQADYEISTEYFRGTDNRTFLRTDVATYEVGKMSRKGMVEMIQSGVARVRTPDRRTLFVVADEAATAKAQAVIVKPEVAPSPKVEIKPPVANTAIERARSGIGPDDRMERIRAGLPPVDSK